MAHGSSPAYSLHAQHPSGGQYADYLDALASSAKLNVRTLTEVISVKAEGGKGGPPRFRVGVRSQPGSSEHAARRPSRVSGPRPRFPEDHPRLLENRPARAGETLTARHVVWAAGEGLRCEQPLFTPAAVNRYVVWAAGEFQYPREGGGAIAGAELCLRHG